MAVEIGLEGVTLIQAPTGMDLNPTGDFWSIIPNLIRTFINPLYVFLQILTFQTQMPSLATILIFYPMQFAVLYMVYTMLRHGPVK